jgi:hypothetical protein
LLDGLKTASSQIETRIGEFTSLIGLVHTEMESAWLGLTGVLKFFGKKSSSGPISPLESKPSSDDI